MASKLSTTKIMSQVFGETIDADSPSRSEPEIAAAFEASMHAYRLADLCAPETVRLIGGTGE